MSKISGKHPRCYILIGLPGSGKSTWRQAFTDENPGYVILSTDDAIDRYAVQYGITYDRAIREIDRKAIESAMKAELGEVIAAGGNFIVDRTNMSRKSRNKILARLPRNYHRVAVDFRIDPKVLASRLKHRAINEGKSIAPELLEGMRAQYEEPSREEFDEIVIVHSG